MRRCPECGDDICCGAGMSIEIERTKDECMAVLKAARQDWLAEKERLRKALEDVEGFLRNDRYKTRVQNALHVIEMALEKK